MTILHLQYLSLAALLCARLSSGLSSPPIANVVPTENPAKTTSSTTSTSLNREELDSMKFPRTWVPIASTFELDPDRPTPIEFLGQKYVTYQDNAKNWVVMDDVCPHRLAPLSEGRVDREADVLQCSYHGWEFDSSGVCTRIPQLSTNEEPKALSTERSCVAAYPVTVEKNIVWIWPWKEDVLSVVGNPFAHPEGMLENIAGSSPITYTRDLPYGWDGLIENLIDPAHVPFAHHGMQGKRTDAIPINMTKPMDLGERGFSFEWQDRTMGMMRAGKGEFRAPFIVNYDAMFKSQTPKPFKLAVICIPTKPGWSRAIVLQGSATESKETDQVDEKKKKKGNLVSLLFSKMPIWLTHQLSNRFLDSDLAFLHFQEQERQRRSNYFMPAPADRCIVALRKWIPKYTGISSQPIPPPLPRSALFDRWTQHTSHCIHCQTGLASIRKWRRSTYVALALSVVGFNFRLAKISTLLCLGALRLLQKLENSFKEGEFKHYENH